MNSQEGVLLNRVMRNAQMGIIGIDSILPKATGAIRPALEAQKKEYVELACEARQLMRRTGENPKNVPHPIRVMATHMGKMKSSIDPSSKHMAKMMTDASTKGAASLQSAINRYNGADEKTKALSKRLMTTEEKNIEQMRAFL